MNPFGVASAVTGLPRGKKKTHRGRKPSGKPGAEHLANLQKAHGAGDHKSARRHALEYAKATRKHESDSEDEEAMEMVQPGPPPSVHDTPISTPIKKPGLDRRAALAKLAMSRKK